MGHHQLFGTGSPASPIATTPVSPSRRSPRNQQRNAAASLQNNNNNNNAAAVTPPPPPPLNSNANPRQRDIELVDDETTFDNGDSGVMGELLTAIQDRLIHELSSRNSAGLNSNWLLIYLQMDRNDFWIRADDAKYICGRLRISYNKRQYYRDVQIWLPDVQFESFGNMMPPCPTCYSSAGVGAHGFRRSHKARRVCTLKAHYFVMSRRYICHTCEQAAEKVKRDAKQAAEQLGFCGVSMLMFLQTPFSIMKSDIKWSRPLEMIQRRNNLLLHMPS
jgi:hypothetical protein